MTVFERLHMPSLGGATAWLNSEPLAPEELRGRVVLVDFWTLTCINWLRTAPYVRAWSRAYRPDGLVMIGVHTPEFSFEHEIERVRRATREREIDYPVAVDNDYEIWSAFANHYWPALYFVDRDGIIRDEHFGEGRYEESERVIQRLLGVERELVSVEGLGVETEADWDSLRTPETHLGVERRDQPVSLTAEWTPARESVVLDQAPGSISFRFHARDAHLVMSSAPSGARSSGSSPSTRCRDGGISPPSVRLSPSATTSWSPPRRSARGPCSHSFAREPRRPGWQPGSPRARPATPKRERDADTNSRRSRGCALTSRPGGRSPITSCPITRPCRASSTRIRRRRPSGAADAPFRGTAKLAELAKTETYTRAYAESNGFLTLLSDGERLTGAYTLGPDAGEWLQQATLAIRAGLPLEVLRDTIQPFPTFSEIYVAALKALRGEIGRNHAHSGQHVSHAA